MEIKQKIGLHSEYRQDIVLNFQCLKQGNCLEALKIKMAKDKNDENVSHFEITKVVLIHCNIVKNDYQ